MEKAPRLSSGRIVAIVLIAIAALLVGRCFISQQMMIIKQQREMKELDAAIVVQSDKLSQLESKAGSYTSDEIASEIARERLGFVRGDETIFVFNAD